MTDKSIVLRSFNNLFFEFLDDLQHILPENTEITYAITTFTTIRRANPTAIIKSWYTFVNIPYYSVIEQGDLTYFFNKDYSEDLVTINKSEEIMKMIDNIRKPIQEMNQVNQQHSLKYLQNLCKLSNIYNDFQ
jgi:hypothetical protein